MLRIPGTTHKVAAPGVPEDIRVLLSLLGFTIIWVGDYAVYHITAPENPNNPRSQEHVFKADPKVLPDEEAWRFLVGQILDFMKDKGYIIENKNITKKDFKALYDSRFELYPTEDTDDAAPKDN